MNCSTEKPAKPTPDFPLFAHGNGQWAKKIKGKLCYFGKWNDPQGALARYLGQPQVSKQTKVFHEAPAVKGSKQEKPKPKKDFPPYAHTSGRWIKKISGKVRYFGPWDDPQAALEKWLDQKDDLLAGREPRESGDGLTVRSLVNQFLESKENLVKTGELTPRCWNDYDAVCGKIIEVFGRSRLVTDLRHTDFERLRKEFTKGIGKKCKGHGPISLSNDIGRARVVFNYAHAQELIDRPIVFGDGFKKPSRRILRKVRNEKGPRLFTPDQVRALVAKAGPQMKAMIYLGINCGLGNHDCALLPVSAIKDGWLSYPRPKTGIERRAELWPETVAALQAVLDRRRETAHADLLFITKYGNPWE